MWEAKISLFLSPLLSLVFPRLLSKDLRQLFQLRQLIYRSPNNMVRWRRREVFCGFVWFSNSFSEFVSWTKTFICASQLLFPPLQWGRKSKRGWSWEFPSWYGRLERAGVRWKWVGVVGHTKIGHLEFFNSSLSTVSLHQFIQHSSVFLSVLAPAVSFCSW